ncbi:KAP family NTPase [Salegentibacter mishustinae]|uniref:KAP family P-loop NTPase fold protein n=1 Tax=Salegentibacter mishustinae TaxID=270918 RepID=UPI001CE03B78|nr:P-loop NTPase fold protein [Salegentibacter mishustinae]UBZ07252.1 KAP family NTPase [Salegentibacter mishustinae]
MLNFESLEFKLGFIVLVFIALVGYMFLFDKKYIVSRKGHLTAITLFSVYLIFRIFDFGIIYLPVSASLKYIDISVLLFLIHIIHWKNTKQKNSKINSEEKDFFINDHVYVDGEIDNELIVQRLIDRITGYKPINSFSIGINAEWGFGKSTFLHRFKNEFEKTNPETIMFWFHIWKNKGDKAIIDNFFKEFSTNLKPYSGEIEDKIEKYTDAILSVSPGEISKVINAGKNIFREEHSLEEYYRDIQSAIQKIDRQIIIILDDLDRLEESEILDTYKIIRTLSDFDNVIFMAGYDRDYLEGTLGKNKVNYINKIFQVEINLLPFDEGQINEMLLDGIKDVFPHRKNQDDNSDELVWNEKLFQVFYALFSRRSYQISSDMSDITLDNLHSDDSQFNCSELKLNFKHFLRTYRDLKRFLNEFKFNKAFIHSGDVYLPDYVLFRLLSFRYRNLHNLLFEDISDFLELKDYDTVNLRMQDSWNDNEGSHYIYSKNSKEKVFKRLEGQRFKSQDIEIINSSLCILFGEKSNHFYKTNPKTISKSYYTNIYLRNNIASGSYTYSDFEEYWESDKLKDLISKMISLSQNIRFQAFNELKEFLYKKGLTITNKNEFSKFIISLNLFNPIFLVNDYHEIEKIFKKQFTKIQNLNSKDFKDALVKSKEAIGPIDRFLADILINAARLEREDIYTDKNSIEYKEFPLEISDTKLILLEKLEYVLRQNVGYNIQFNYYALQVDFIAVDHKVIIAFKADELFKEHLKKWFLHFVWGDYLDFKGEPQGFPKERQTYKPNDFLCQIFCNKEDWDKLKADKKDSDLYKNFRNNGFHNYNDFLKSQEVENIFVGEDHKLKLERIKKLMEAFIKNDYQPLNRKQFQDIASEGGDL